MVVKLSSKHKGSTSLRLININTALSLVVISCFMLTPTINVKAATLDDLRELMGQTRLDQTFTPSQEKSIESNYYVINQHNLLAQSINESNPSSLNSQFNKERYLLGVKLSLASSKLVLDFSSDRGISTILKDSSSISNLQYAISKVPKDRAVLSMPLESNPYTSDYNKILEINATIKGYRDFGTVGNYLISPIANQFVLFKPFGSILNEHTHKYSFNNGIDLLGSKRSKVYSIWSGYVSSIRGSSTKGLTISVSNGNGIVTVYSNLGYSFVHLGQIVNPNQKIGVLGLSFRYLHFEVIINNNPVNPIYFFGFKGSHALQNFIDVSTNPSILAMQNLVYKIKDGTKAQLKAWANIHPLLYGQIPVNYNKPDTSPAGSIKLSIKSGYTMPKPSALIK